MVTMVWDKQDAEANAILRMLMQHTRYPWVYRKLNNARWHIIETRCRRVPEDRNQEGITPTNGDIYDGLLKGGV